MVQVRIGYRIITDATSVRPGQIGPVSDNMASVQDKKYHNFAVLSANRDFRLGRHFDRDGWRGCQINFDEISFAHIMGGIVMVICHKDSWVSKDRQQTSNQIDHIAIISEFTSCLLSVHNKRKHHRMVAKLCLVSLLSLPLAFPPQFNTDRLPDSVVDSCHVSDTNIKLHARECWWSLVRLLKCLCLWWGRNGHIPKGHYTIWLTVET